MNSEVVVCCYCELCINMEGVDELTSLIYVRTCTSLCWVCLSVCLWLTGKPIMRVCHSACVVNWRLFWRQFCRQHRKCTTTLCAHCAGSITPHRLTSTNTYTVLPESTSTCTIQLGYHVPTSIPAAPAGILYAMSNYAYYLCQSVCLCFFLFVLLSMGAPVMVELDGETDPLKIATKELKWVRTVHVASISRHSLKTKHWNKQHKQILIFAWICIGSKEDLLYGVFCWRSGLLWRQTAHTWLLFQRHQHL